MSPALILLTIILCFAITLYFLHRWLRPSTASDALSDWLNNSTLQINQRLDATTQLMANVQKNLGEMSEIGRGIKSLQEFLQSPKLRGGLGEEVLNQMLNQTFPKNSFHLQYAFRSGAKVDAVLKTDAGLLCIDSKFPLENYQAMLNSPSDMDFVAARKNFISDVKRHISDISRKYILPDEGTLDFALMYIPSEAVYYELANILEINETARDNRVYPVSPNTLYAHLQVLLLSFQGKELASQTKQIFQTFRALQKDYSRLQGQLSILQKHISNAYNQSSQVSKSADQIGLHLSTNPALDKVE